MSDQTPQYLGLAHQIRPTLMQLHFMIRRAAPAKSLTPSQQSVMQALHTNGAMRMGELAAHEKIRLPSTTSAIDGLERLGLVERSNDPHDRRAVIVGLSAAGREATAELVKQRDLMLASFLEQLTPEERDALSGAGPALTKLLDLYRASDASTPGA